MAMNTLCLQTSSSILGLGYFTGAKGYGGWGLYGKQVSLDKKIHRMSQIIHDFFLKLMNLSVDVCFRCGT